MGAKDALVKIADLDCGLGDTFAYYTEDELRTNFKRTMAFQPRVIKQNRGSAGEGIWICKLKGKEYCAKYGAAELEDSDVLELTEANDNHVETHTVAEFLEFCVNGQTDKSGTWASTGKGKYLEGGKASGGQLVDQRFCPRIVEGEVRCLMSGSTPIQFVHKKPKEGGLSAVGGTGSTYTYFEADAPEYADLKAKFVERDLPQLMQKLGLGDEPLPLLWSADFIPVDGAEEGSTAYTIGEFNCSCVGISKFQAVAGGKLSMVSAEDFEEGRKIALAVAAAAHDMLSSRKKGQVWNRLAINK
jgi:hypothetical protein